jgi:hypothetical protein
MPGEFVVNKTGRRLISGSFGGGYVDPMTEKRTTRVTWMTGSIKVATIASTELSVAVFSGNIYNFPEY